MMVQRSKQEFLYTGDFNFDLLSIGGFNLHFLNCMVLNHLFSIVTIQTRMTLLP